MMGGVEGHRDLGRRKMPFFPLHCHFPLSIMEAYVAVLTDLGMTHGNTNGVIRIGAIGKSPYAHSWPGVGALARKMLFLTVRGNSVVSESSTNLEMLLFVVRFFPQEVVRTSPKILK